MFRACACVLLGLLFVLSGGVTGRGQDPKKQENKTEVKKDEPPAKIRGYLPPNWKKLGLSEEQVQKVYRIQAKYGEEIDKLEAKIADLKAVMDKERRAVLTADQKKRLEEILLGKDK